MSWHKMSETEKREWLNQQLEDIQRTRKLLERFEKVTQRWLKKLQAPASKKQA